MIKSKLEQLENTYWDLLLQEVLNKKNKIATYYFIPTQAFEYSNDKKNIAEPKRNRYQPQRYFLGDSFGEVYLTKREAESIMALMLTKTVVGAGRKLLLSPRTVEFYLDNIKKKLGCRKKKQVIDLIMKSDLMKHDFNHLK